MRSANYKRVRHLAAVKSWRTRRANDKALKRGGSKAAAVRFNRKQQTAARAAKSVRQSGPKYKKALPLRGPKKRVSRQFSPRDTRVNAGFKRYKEAYRFARRRAKASKRDFAIMKNAFGELSVFPAHGTSDYAKYEIIKPGSPRVGIAARGGGRLLRPRRRR